MGARSAWEGRAVRCRRSPLPGGRPAAGPRRDRGSTEQRILTALGDAARADERGRGRAVRRRGRRGVRSWDMEGNVVRPRSGQERVKGGLDRADSRPGSGGEYRSGRSGRRPRARWDAGVAWAEGASSRPSGVIRGEAAMRPAGSSGSLERKILNRRAWARGERGDRRAGWEDERLGCTA